MRPANILFIDDRTDLIGSIVDEVRGLGAQAVAEHPDDVDADQLNNADLVLLDFDLGRTEFDPEVPPLQRAHDGLGLAQIVRSYHRAQERSGAVALLSDKLSRLFGAEVPHASEHAIARVNGLEWAFDKKAHHLGPAERIVDLAEATIAAAASWEPQRVATNLDALRAFLSLPSDSPWVPHAEALLNAAQPPAHSLAAATNGLSVVRWLAQRVLPYPGLLLDDRYAAVLLGATPDSFVSELAPETELSARLSEAEYRGALGGFTERRWWRSAIHRLVIELNNGRPVADPRTIERLNRDTGASLIPTPGRSVIALNCDLEPYASPVARHEAVRIRPDDWPVFAEPGFVPISLFADDGDEEDIVRLRAYVEPADLPLLDEAQPPHD